LRQTHSGELRVEIEPVENEDLDEFHEQQNEYIETLKLLDEGVYAQEEVDSMFSYFLIEKFIILLDRFY
jgi:hypothetical protein